MRFLDFIGQLVLRLGLFAITTFLSVCLGLLDYILIKGLLYLLHHGELGHLGLEFTIFQGIVLFIVGVGIAAMSCGAVGIFGWGFLCIFDFD